jgi:NAD+ synthase (glutamine-hydrolysing)
MRAVRLALAQINAVVGDVAGNARRVLDEATRAYDMGADLVAFPEQTLAGYPAEDLLLVPSFLEANERALRDIAARAPDLVLVVGFPRRAGEGVYNSAAVVAGGRIDTCDKQRLPNYGVFDEERYFEPGEAWKVFDVGSFAFGLTICEDMWVESQPLVWQAETGAHFLLNISASPYHMLKVKEREELLADRARAAGTWLAYCNLVGGQDELIFDGASLVVSPRGECVAAGKQFAEDLLIVDVPVARPRRCRTPEASEPLRAPASPMRAGSRKGSPAEAWTKVAVVTLPRRRLRQRRPPLPPTPKPAFLPRAAEVWAALVLGVRDYVRKNRFGKVVLGLSGGIDSAVTAALAADALGPGNVTGVSMPSRYSSTGTRTDAERVAENLGINFLTLPIEPVYTAYLESLRGAFGGRQVDTTEENIQARVRGNLLMALSNKFGWMVLSTGNKSEVSVGYCTLYGDMTGGFDALKDVPKTLVYQLADYANERAGREVILRSIIDRPPTAELRPDQTDQDTLPPYDVLDTILKEYLENDASAQEVVAKGFDPEVVRRTIRMVDTNEYKRRQGPPGVKITPRAFGKDRRMPITNRFQP